MTPEERAREIAERYTYRLEPNDNLGDFVRTIATAIREAVAEQRFTSAIYEMEAEVARRVRAGLVDDDDGLAFKLAAAAQWLRAKGEA